MTRYKITPPWGLHTSTYWPFHIEGADLVDTRTGHTYIDGAYRVVDERTGKVARTFKGETAWSHAESLARDLMFAARHDAFEGLS